MVDYTPSSQNRGTKIHTPALVVMLGSTPGRAGLELCRHMLTLSPADCRRLALVHIDTADSPSEVASFYKEHEGLFRYFPQRIAIPVSINYAPMPIEPLHTYIPSKMPQPFANGAGGIRNNGHVAAAFDHAKIKQTLEAALQHLELLGTTQGEISVHEVHVNIVAFLGGGTGSGILGDIAVMVRQILLERLYEQRINLFCILPDSIQGANTNDMNWRKSNATACLLELIALSLAGDAKRHLTYRKYMHNYPYDVSADAIANEVYLIGRTSMGTADDTARIVGLDLFQRIVDGSGVGSLEHDTWPNRRSLGATDDRGLPTMFATSCPMEVRFPAHETARAFAQIAAAYLLPQLIGSKPPVPDVSEEMREHWEQAWESVAELTNQPLGRSMAVRRADDLSVDQFTDAPPETLEDLWREVQRRRKVTEQRIEAVIGQKRREEFQRINHVPAALDERLSPLTRQINHLHLLKEEYITVLQQVKGNKIEEPEHPQPRHSALDSLIFVLPIVGKTRKMRHTQDLCDAYNDAMYYAALKARNDLLQKLLEDLLERVEVLLREKLSWYNFRDDRLSRRCQQLLATGFSSAAWHGKLDVPHPHQRHIFDLATLQPDGRSKPVERLFMAVTFPPTQDTWQPSSTTALLFDEEVVKAQISRYVDPCTAYLNKGMLADDDNPAPIEDVELQSREQFVERIVSFFQMLYLQQFLGNAAAEKPALNLFDLLKIGAGLERGGSSSHYLLEHLSHMKGLMRSLIAFQETLWYEGPDRLAITVFMGMSWGERTNQRQELIQAVNMLGTITHNNQTPQIEKLDDPHRLQVCYGQHGISLATIPEFFRDTNSSMAQYIRHQSEWYGDQQPVIMPHPYPNTYGKNKMPVHNSGEMERIVCDPTALYYQTNQPHASKYHTNLIGRIIREAEDLHTRPNWGTPPSTGPQAGPGQQRNVPRPPAPLPVTPLPGPITPVPSNQPAARGAIAPSGHPGPSQPAAASMPYQIASAPGAPLQSGTAHPAQTNGSQAAPAQVANQAQQNIVPPSLGGLQQGPGTSAPVLPTDNVAPPQNGQAHNGASTPTAPGINIPPQLGQNNNAAMDELLRQAQSRNQPGGPAPHPTQGTGGGNPTHPDTNAGPDTFEPDTHLPS